MGKNVILPNVRKMFIPDEGYTIFDCDLAGADAQVVAFEAEDYDLINAFRAGLDVHSKNSEDMWGSAFTSLPGDKDNGPKSKKRKQCKQAVHLCLTDDHEVLTPLGWVSITDKPHTILCWATSNDISWGTVSSWYDAETTTEFHEYANFAFNQKVTFDHKFPYKTDDKGFRIQSSSQLPASARLPKSGLYIGGGSNFSPIEAKLLCAIQADAHTSTTNHWRFHLKRQRKIDRLHSILNAMGLQFAFTRYDDGTTMTTFDWSVPYGKELDAYVLTWPTATITSYVEEASYWDGEFTSTPNHKRESFCNKNETQVRWFQTMTHLINKASQVLLRPGLCTASLNNRPFWRRQKPIITKETRRVLCPKTPTGFFLVRRNGVISVTGNTNYGGSARTAAKVLGWTVAEAEAFQRRWFSIHPGIKKNFHGRVDASLRASRTVMNRFGYRRVYFDRIDQCFTEALAWIPQSTVAEVSFRGALQLEEQLPCAQMLIQVHDSVVFQVPHSEENRLDDIRRALLVPIPYGFDSLTIGWGMARSRKSWGDCEGVK